MQAPIENKFLLKFGMKIFGRKNWKLRSLMWRQLNGDLSEDIYVKIPGVMHLKEASKGCRLQKSLYGLKQAIEENDKKSQKMILVSYQCDSYNYRLYNPYWTRYGIQRRYLIVHETNEYSSKQMTKSQLTWTHRLRTKLLQKMRKRMAPRITKKKKSTHKKM